jgi:hypothetical protein
MASKKTKPESVDKRDVPLLVEDDSWSAGKRKDPFFEEGAQPRSPAIREMMRRVSERSS